MTSIGCKLQGTEWRISTNMGQRQRCWPPIVTNNLPTRMRKIGVCPYRPKLCRLRPPRTRRGRTFQVTSSRNSIFGRLRATRSGCSVPTCFRGWLAGVEKGPSIHQHPAPISRPSRCEQRELCYMSAEQTIASTRDSDSYHLSLLGETAGPSLASSVMPQLHMFKVTICQRLSLPAEGKQTILEGLVTCSSLSTSEMLIQI